MVFVMGLISFLGGVLNTVQAGSNSTLAKTLQQPILAALIVTAVNGLAYLALAPFIGLHLPKAEAFAAVSWWAWIGGALGGTYVLTSIFFAEKLGSGIFIGLTVTAGVITSVVMDHYGLVGFKQHTASWPRLIGAGLMIAGLGLVAAF